MRISDWSSDVCSSDLDCKESRLLCELPSMRPPPIALLFASFVSSALGDGDHSRIRGQNLRSCSGLIGLIDDMLPSWREIGSLGFCRRRLQGRSEEHTSELQSLMRISYAVFCLKKKKIKITSRL